MVVLVTGGHGRVGKTLYNIKPDWIYMSSKDVDLRNFNDTYDYVLKYNPKTIIHLAANVGKQISNKFDILWDNILMNLNIVRICGILKIRLIGCLSVYVFPEDSQYEQTEDMLHTGLLNESTLIYAYAKRTIDLACQMYPNLNYTCFIPCNTYGPNDNEQHVIPTIIRKAQQAKKHGGKLCVDTMNTLQQYIHVYDVARLIVAIFELSNSPKRIILAPCEQVDINVIANKIAKAYDLELEYDECNIIVRNKRILDNKMLKHYFPDFTFTLFEQGLTDTIKWFDNLQTILERNE